MKPFDIVALGELLIDFTPAGKSAQGSDLFAKNPGGAPANVLTMARRMGTSAAFIGMVGEDAFGRYLADVLRGQGIDTRGMRFTAEAPTTLAFVEIDGAGDRRFSFVRNPGADTRLHSEDLDDALLANCRIFHFGLLSMTDEPARSATLAAIDRAGRSGALISFDPNYRAPLWPSPERAVAVMRDILGRADIIKLSEEELAMLGYGDPAAGAEAIVAQGVSLCCVTLGAEGCYYRTARGGEQIPAFPVSVRDTTGAGDAFTGALLAGLCGLAGPITAADPAALQTVVRTACAAGSLCTAKFGAIPAMPSRVEVETLLARPGPER